VLWNSKDLKRRNWKDENEPKMRRIRKPRKPKSLNKNKRNKRKIN
jgi:hypothetical protein